MEGPYKLSEDEEMIMTTVRDLAKDKIAPRAADIDKTGEFPWDVIDLYRQSQILSRAACRTSLSFRRDTGSKLAGKRDERFEAVADGVRVRQFAFVR